MGEYVQQIRVFKGNDAVEQANYFVQKHRNFIHEPKFSFQANLTEHHNSFHVMIEFRIMYKQLRAVEMKEIDARLKEQRKAHNKSFEEMK